MGELSAFVRVHNLHISGLPGCVLSDPGLRLDDAQLLGEAGELETVTLLGLSVSLASAFAPGRRLEDLLKPDRRRDGAGVWFVELRCVVHGCFVNL